MKVDTMTFVGAFQLEIFHASMVILGEVRNFRLITNYYVID